MDAIYAPPQDPLVILHHDHEVILLDKPAGLLSVPGKGPELADCLIAHGRARSEEPADQQRLLTQMGHVLRHTRDLRRMGAAALDLCYLGAGRFDGFWEEGLKPWDIAAGIVIAREAGVYITDTSGGPVSLKSGSVLAGNPNIHSQLHKALAGR